MPKNIAQIGAPSIPELCRAVQNFASEILPFVQLAVRDLLLAESITQDLVLICLENQWVPLTAAAEKSGAYGDFREDIYRTAWTKAYEVIEHRGKKLESAYSVDAMPIFQLDVADRVALFLRSRLKFSYPQIQFILNLESSEEAFQLVEEARLRLLGPKWQAGSEVSLLAEFEQDGDPKGSRFDV